MAGLLLAPSNPRTAIEERAWTEPDITGPVPGTATIAGGPHALPAGYVEEEFLLSGTATAYRGVGELGADGAWANRAGRRGRVRDPAAGPPPGRGAAPHGTVVVEWLNVSAGADACPEWMRVAPAAGPGRRGVGRGVRAAGRDRGGRRLGHGRRPARRRPGARYGSWCTRATPGPTTCSRRPRTWLRAGGVLGPLRAQRVIAAGVSQSAACLVTYLNGVARTAGAFDAYLVHSRGGGAVPIGGVPFTADGRPDLDTVRAGDTRLRTDLDVPVLVLEDRDRPDRARLRQRPPARHRPVAAVEVAGTAHRRHLPARRAPAPGRDDGGGAGPDVRTDDHAVRPGGTHRVPINAGVQHHYVAQAALAHLDRWVRDGVPAPTAPRLELAAIRRSWSPTSWASPAAASAPASSTCRPRCCPGWARPA